MYINLLILYLSDCAIGSTFLAHLWGAYATPGVVRRPSSVVRRVSSLSTITTRNN